MKEYLANINKEIADYFGETDFRVEEDKTRAKCDLRLCENFRKEEPEGRRDAVAAYIFYRHPEVLTIAYGGVYYSRDSLMVAIFKGWAR